MVPLAREIVLFLASEFGRDEVLRRLADPYWFQAFGCVLGFDWHSSGVTTTVCGALKEGLRGTERELGIYVAGGKGATSRKTPAEITTACERLGRDPAPLVYASRISAKVDNSAVQDGYQLYHHSFVFTATGDWCIVQQGMSDETSMARRYHWLSDSVTSYVNEPHAAVCCDARADTLNLGNNKHIDTIGAKFTFNGGAGTDAVNVDVGVAVAREEGDRVVADPQDRLQPFRHGGGGAAAQGFERIDVSDRELASLQVRADEERGSRESHHRAGYMVRAQSVAL